MLRTGKEKRGKESFKGEMGIQNLFDAPATKLIGGRLSASREEGRLGVLGRG